MSFSSISVISISVFQLSPLLHIQMHFENLMGKQYNSLHWLLIDWFFVNFSNQYFSISVMPSFAHTDTFCIANAADDFGNLMGKHYKNLFFFYWLIEFYFVFQQFFRFPPLSHKQINTLWSLRFLKYLKHFKLWITTWRCILKPMQQTNFENIVVKEKLLISSYFSFCHNVFNSIQ